MPGLLLQAPLDYGERRAEREDAVIQGARAMFLMLRHTELRISDVALLARSRVRDGQVLLHTLKTAVRSCCRYRRTCSPRSNRSPTLAGRTAQQLTRVTSSGAAQARSARRLKWPSGRSPQCSARRAYPAPTRTGSGTRWRRQSSRPAERRRTLRTCSASANAWRESTTRGGQARARSGYRRSCEWSRAPQSRPAEHAETPVVIQ